MRRAREFASVNLHLAAQRPGGPRSGCSQSADPDESRLRNGPRRSHEEGRGAVECGTTLLRAAGPAPRPLPQLRLYVMAHTSLRGV